MENDHRIAVLENEIEALLLSSILDERSIPHRIDSHRDTAYDGLFQTQRGWGVIIAPAAFGPEILEILAEIREGSEPEQGRRDSDG